ncbi:MAG: hypothetical protein C0467_07795 [Planctomycetaceae bacterium]|nr:hypothetical protein [Planctomycetaceae bacterium]
MEHTTPHTAPTATVTKPIVAPIGGGLSGASIGLGFFSMIVFFWFPFSPIISSVGLILGLISLCRGARGPRGENFALGGVALCGLSLSLTITLNFVLRYLQWDTPF